MGNGYLLTGPVACFGYSLVAVSGVRHSHGPFAGVILIAWFTGGLAGLGSRWEAYWTAFERIRVMRAKFTNSPFVMTGSQVRVLFAAPVSLSRDPSRPAAVCNESDAGYL